VIATGHLPQRCGDDDAETVRRLRLLPERRWLILLGGGFAGQLGFRIAQVALPVMTLSRTGSVWMTGLVGGATGIPSMLAPWWARRPQQLIDNGKRLAVLHVLAALTVAALPLSPSWNPALLIGVGLGLGVQQTLAMPALSTMLADRGEAVALAWQDAGMRTAMVLGPITAGVLLTLVPGGAVLVAECVGYAVAAALFVCMRVRQPAGAVSADDVPRLRDCLKGQSQLLRGWIIRGTGCFGWFAFSVGLPLLSPSLAATGFAAYGLAGLAGSVVAVWVVRHARPAVASGLSWSAAGVAFVMIGLWPAPVAVASAAAVAGLAVPAGNAAITASLVQAHRGPWRRAALAGQQTVVNSTSTAGLFAGAFILGFLGARGTLILMGLLIVMVATGLVGHSVYEWTRHRSGPRQFDPAAEAAGDRRPGVMRQSESRQ
jgi:predicted MFS family arabinose efflux permease